MTDSNLSRRGFMHGMAALALAGSNAAYGELKSHVPQRESAASAAGQILIGGDLRVNRIGLGTTEFTSPRGVPAADAATLRALLRRAVELGVNHIDCADVYGSGLVEGLCERYIYDALYPYPADLVIATKGGQVRNAARAQLQTLDGRPQHLRAACEASLKRLRLERIPLYYMHQPDPKVPYEDSIGELGRLQTEGKIRHIGVSNVTPEQFAKARSLVRVAAIQNRYNILAKQADDILSTCEREHIAFIPFSPLGGRTAATLNEGDARLVGLKALAAEKHVDMAQIVLAWLLKRSPSIIVIPGTTKIEHLESDIAAAKVHLTRQDVERIDRLG